MLTFQSSPTNLPCGPLQRDFLRAPSSGRLARWSLLTVTLALSLVCDASGQGLVLDDPLHGSTIGTRSGGRFTEGGWQVTGHDDTIYWHVATLVAGAVEWDVRGLRSKEDRAGMEDKAEIFHMYDHTFGEADVKYNGGYRDNPFKHFVRKIGAKGGATDALELVWQILPQYDEPDTRVLTWDTDTTYHFRQEWRPDGKGNSIFRTFRDGELLKATTVEGRWMPKGHCIRIAASPRSPIAADAGAPIDAIYSNVKVWDLAAPLGELPPPRQGKVSVKGHALQDDGGKFLGLGASYFQALRHAKYDRELYRKNADFLARRGFHYIRTLAMVGWNPAWKGKEIAPVNFTNQQGEEVQSWDDYDQQLKDMVDIAYDEFGLRTQITLFADAQLMPAPDDRTAHMDRILAAVRGREHKVILLEVANEYWQNGFADPEGTADVRACGKYLADRTDILVALSSPPGGSVEGLERMYQESAADIATQHFSRDVRTNEGHWLTVRDPWWVNSAAGVPPVSSNEPIGPGSSVNAENEPIRLVSAATYAWMSGLPMYVYHTRAGVFGDERFEDMPGADAYGHLAKVLPGDIASWPQRTEGRDDFAPFTTYANGEPNRWWPDVPDPTSGVVRHLSVVNDDRFCTLPIGILAHGVQLQARRDMSIQVFHPLTGEVVNELTPSADESFVLAQGPEAYLIRGRYAGSRPVSIDLGEVNDIDGLVHRHLGDGDTVSASIGNRSARRNQDPDEDFYMYFAVADWFALEGNQSNLYVTIDYFDGPNGTLTLQYDSSAGSALADCYKLCAGVELKGSNTWKRHTFHVTDAYFGNRQNHGADLRIYGGKGKDFYVAKVVVSRNKP